MIGCDSDDGPTVTAPAPGGGSGNGGSGNGGNNAPTRDTTAEEQGRDGLEETENGTMIRNKGEVALNVRFGYNTARHYLLNPGVSMPSDPQGGRGAPARVACGVPATGRANGQCYRNDGVATPQPYTNGAKRSIESENQGQRCRRSINREIRNVCSNVTLNVGFCCGTSGQLTHYFAIPPGEMMAGRPINCAGTIWSAPCGAPGVASPVNGQFECHINTGITPGPYTGTPTTPITIPPSSLWGSVAFGHLSRGYTWNFKSGSTESEARSSALADCRSDGSTDCQSLEFTRGQCAALAHGTRTIPSFGVSVRSTKLAAQNAAIEQCRIARGTNCRIATGDNGHVASVCLPSS